MCGMDESEGVNRRHIKPSTTNNETLTVEIFFHSPLSEISNSSNEQMDADTSASASSMIPSLPFGTYVRLCTLSRSLSL